MSDLPSLTLIVVAGLATARLSSLIVHDDILEPLRHRIFLHSPPPEEPGEEVYTVADSKGLPFVMDAPRGVAWSLRAPGFVGSLLSCTHCVAVWVAAAVYLALRFVPDVALPVLVVAAFAQISEATIKASR